MEPEVLPVTAQEDLSSKIAASLKISRTVLEDRLKEELDEIEKEVNSLRSDWNISSRTFTRTANEYAKDTMYGLEEMHDLVAAVNAVIPDDQAFKHVDQLIQSVAATPVNGNGFESWRLYQLKETLASGDLNVRYTLRVAVYSHRTEEEDENYCDEESNSYNIVLPLGDEGVLASLNDAIEARTGYEGALEKLNELNLKLATIDDTLRKVEAKLLIDSLQGSTEGKAILEMTQGIITEFLSGEDSDLLQLEEL